MLMLVMPLPWLGIVRPGLCNLEVYLVLWVVNRSEVVSQRGLDKVPQFGHLLVAQNRIVNRGGIAHVGPCLLTLDEVNLFLGQITIKFVDADRGGEEVMQHRVLSQSSGAGL